MRETTEQKRARRVRNAEAVEQARAVFVAAPPREGFTFSKRWFRYFEHDYNCASLNDRSVEVALARVAYPERGKRVLEVGNVLRHYFPMMSHPVVDKYEVAPGVTNADVMDYAPRAQVDLVVSLSTIEHVGHDEKPRDPRKAARSLHRMRSWLAPSGKMLVTWPIGHNRGLDEALASGSLPFDDVGYMLRVSAANEWREASWADVRSCKMHYPFHWGNGLVVGAVGDPFA